MGNCRDDVSKPSVDETQIECCGAYPTNCVVASTTDPFLKTKKGDTLSNILAIISNKLLKLFQKFNELDKYFEFTSVFNQEGLNGITFTGSKNTYVASVSSVRNGVGDFSIIFSQPVLTSGTIVIIPLKSFPKYHTYTVTGGNTINILSYDEFGNLADSNLADEFIHIKTPK